MSTRKSSEITHRSRMARRAAVGIGLNMVHRNSNTGQYSKVYPTRASATASIRLESFASKFKNKP
jgi:hypothetical protein